MNKHVTAFAIVAGAQCLFPGKAQAQTAVRVDMIHTQAVFASNPMDIFYGMGVDHVTTERTSYGFDLLGAWSFLTSGLGGTESIPYRGNTINYDLKRASAGLLFHSDFALSDNGYTHGYFGPTLGVMWAKSTAKISTIDNPNYEYTRPQDLGLRETAKDAGFIFPAGFRLGVRGGMDGGYADLYVAAGINLGMDKLNPTPFLPKGVDMANSFFSLGLALAFGG